MLVDIEEILRKDVFVKKITKTKYGLDPEPEFLPNMLKIFKIINAPLLLQDGDLWEMKVTYSTDTGKFNKDGKKIYIFYVNLIKKID